MSNTFMSLLHRRERRARKLSFALAHRANQRRWHQQVHQDEVIGSHTARWNGLFMDMALESGLSDEAILRG